MNYRRTKRRHSRMGRSVFPILWAVVLIVVTTAACSNVEPAGGNVGVQSEQTASGNVPAFDGLLAAADLHEQPSTVYYEIFVRSFYDSNGDGIGDLRGVTEKLDYLRELGIGGIWLMPIQPSPSYHGYDVTDYYEVNPEYGTMEDLKELLDEAHRRGIKVLMDLVVNHTSSEHPWFQAAAADADSPYRSWYTWAEPGQKLATDGATGSNPWHSSGNDHYLGVFWEGMPDLNFDNPEVRAEMIKIGQFWLKQGFDGFRLDAAKHIYEDFKSNAASQEVKEKNKAWWQEFRAGLNEVNPNAYLVGEVWDTTATIGPYLNQALDSCFNFDLAKTILSNARSEKASDIGFALSRSYQFYKESSQGTFIDAIFLTNHDQNRVMSELDGKVEHAKMAASILLTLPGNPFIYYGEEIGMLGMKPDERIREPMVWAETDDSSAGTGQTAWMPAFYNKDGGSSVSTQLQDPDSLLHHYRKMIQWRNEHAVLQNGDIVSYNANNASVLAYARITNQEKALVLHNLSGERQSVAVRDTSFSTLALASGTGAKLSDGQLDLPPYSTVLLK